MPAKRTDAKHEHGQARTVALAVLTLLAILGGAWSVAGTLLAPVIPGGGATILAAALLLTALPLATLIGTRSLGVYPGRLVRLLVFRPFWYAQFLVLLVTLTGTAGALAGAALGLAVEAGRVAALATVALFTVLVVVGYAGSRRLETRRFVATLPELPGGLEGLRIVQISDLHVGPHTSRAFLEKVAAMVRAASPELIAVTGDLIDDFPADVDRYADVLGSLAAPLGVYAVPGNHELYAGWNAVRARLERLPLTVLVNGGVVVGRGGSQLAVVGTGDPAFGPGSSGSAAPDVAGALADVPPGAFVLALAHNPVLWPALSARGVHLTLSGHTHWGQLGFERRGWCLASPFLRLAMGSHSTGGCLLYIHPGTGYWGMPFRLGHSAQVAVIELRRGHVPSLRPEA